VPQRPLILVTNDDGLLSPGLHAAAEAVADLGDLLLAAPATQQTAMSRAFVRDADSGVVERVELNIAGRTVSGYAISGSPVMAVTHAVLELAERPIGLCVSGINYGENIGGTIGVSGTIGAALEAEAYGIPSIATAITAQISEWRRHVPHADYVTAGGRRSMLFHAIGTPAFSAACSGGNAGSQRTPRNRRPVTFPAASEMSQKSAALPAG